MKPEGGTQDDHTDRTPENQLPVQPGDLRHEVVGTRHGMFGVEGSGDTSGYGGLVRTVALPGGTEPPYGGWFDDVARTLQDGLAALGLPDALEKVVVHRGEITFFIRRERVLETAQVLRDDEALRFELCSGVSGVHYPEETGRDRRASAVEVVDAGQAAEQLEPQRVVVPQRPDQRHQVLAGDEVGDLSAVDEHPRDGRGVRGLPDGLDQRVGDLVEVPAVRPLGGVQRDGSTGLDPHEPAEAGGVATPGDAEGALPEAAARCGGTLRRVEPAAVPRAGHRHAFPRPVGRSSGSRTALPPRRSIRNWPVRPSAAASS
jgi:hypothetical protein